MRAQLGLVEGRSVEHAEQTAGRAHESGRLTGGNVYRTRMPAEHEAETPTVGTLGIAAFEEPVHRGAVLGAELVGLVLDRIVEPFEDFGESDP